MDLSDVTLTRTETVRVEAPPERVWALVTDIGRTGEWSPVCTTCEWDEGYDAAAGPRVGDWFTGHNEHAGRVWETRSEVVTADPGRAFAWQVGGDLVRWGYQLAPAAGGEATDLTETWEFLPGGWRCSPSGTATTPRPRCATAPSRPTPASRPRWPRSSPWPRDRCPPGQPPGHR